MNRINYLAILAVFELAIINANAQVYPPIKSQPQFLGPIDYWEISTDRHPGWSGSRTCNNSYQLRLETYDQNNRYYIQLLGLLGENNQAFGSSSGTIKFGLQGSVMSIVGRWNWADFRYHSKMESDVHPNQCCYGDGQACERWKSWIDRQLYWQLLEFEVTNIIRSKGIYSAVFAYDSGMCGLTVTEIKLIARPTLSPAAQILSGNWRYFEFESANPGLFWIGRLDSVVVNTNGDFMAIHITDTRPNGQPYDNPCCCRVQVTGNLMDSLITINRRITDRGIHYNAVFRGILDVKRRQMKGTWEENGKLIGSWSANK